MNEMIEKAIRAIADVPFVPTACACLGKENQNDPGCSCQMRRWRAEVQAVINALKEPTEAMCEVEMPTLMVPKGIRLAVWRAMIRVALSNDSTEDRK